VTTVAPIILSEQSHSQLRDLLIFASNQNMFVSLGRLPYDRGQGRLFFVEVSAGRPPVFAHVEALTANEAIHALWRQADLTFLQTFKDSK